jgi:hypothetical protein
VGECAPNVSCDKSLRAQINPALYQPLFTRQRRSQARIENRSVPYIVVTEILYSAPQIFAFLLSHKVLSEATAQRWVDSP